jgi:hypothetical protein
MSNPILSDLTVLIINKAVIIGLPILILLGGFVTLVFIYLDSRRRRIRSQIQNLMEKREELIPGVAEEVFATCLSDALLKDEFDKIGKIDITPYVSIFYRDAKFKKRVYCNLVQALAHNHYRIDVHHFVNIAAAVETWRSQADSYGSSMLEHVKQASMDQKSGKAIARLLARRPSFFHTIFENFMINMRDVLLVSARKCPPRLGE